MGSFVGTLHSSSQGTWPQSQVTYKYMWAVSLDPSCKVEFIRRINALSAIEKLLLGLENG